MRSNLSNSSFWDCRLDSPSFALTQKRSNCRGQCQYKKGMSHSLTASLYWKGRSDFPAKAAQTTEAVKKQSSEFQLHRTAEPYVVVSLLLFILIKGSSKAFWHAGYQTFLSRTDKSKAVSRLFYIPWGLLGVISWTAWWTSYVSGQSLYFNFRSQEVTGYTFYPFLISQGKRPSLSHHCQYCTQKFSGWTS